VKLGNLPQRGLPPGRPFSVAYSSLPQPHNEEETQLFDVLWLLLASVVFVPAFQKLPGGETDCSQSPVTSLKSQVTSHRSIIQHCFVPLVHTNHAGYCSVSCYWCACRELCAGLLGRWCTVVYQRYSVPIDACTVLCCVALCCLFREPCAGLLGCGCPHRSLCPLHHPALMCTCSVHYHCCIQYSIVFCVDTVVTGALAGSPVLSYLAVGIAMYQWYSIPIDAVCCTVQRFTILFCTSLLLCLQGALCWVTWLRVPSSALMRCPSSSTCTAPRHSLSSGSSSSCSTSAWRYSTSIVLLYSL